MTLVAAWFRIPFWQRVVAGFVLGALAGWAFGPSAETWFGPLGDLYVTLIKMIAIPLVFFAVINAVSSLHGQKSVAALGGRTFLWFVITAVLAVGVGLAVGIVVQPGVGVTTLQVDPNYVPKDVPSPIQVLLNVVPSNPFQALTGIGTTKNAAGETVLAAGKGSILPVIFFAMLLGFAMVKLGDRVAGARKLAGEASEVMIQVTRFVLEVTPIGTFGLIAALVGAYGFEKLLPLLSFVGALYLACALHIVFVYSGLLLAHGLNPIKFFRGAAAGMQVAFISSSERRTAHERLARVCFIDYDRVMVLVAESTDPANGERSIVAVGRLVKAHGLDEGVEAPQAESAPQAEATPQADAAPEADAAPQTDAEPEAEAAPPEEITYHAVEKDGQVTAIWEMQGRKHHRTIDPRSRQGQEILRLYTAEHGE